MKNWAEPVDFKMMYLFICINEQKFESSYSVNSYNHISESK